jgi:hypothetical protein
MLGIIQDPTAEFDPGCVKKIKPVASQQQENKLVAGESFMREPPSV